MPGRGGLMRRLADAQKVDSVLVVRRVCGEIADLTGVSEETAGQLEAGVREARRRLDEQAEARRELFARLDQAADADDAKQVRELLVLANATAAHDRTETEDGIVEKATTYFTGLAHATLICYRRLDGGAGSYGSEESRIGTVELKARGAAQAQEFRHGHRTTAGRRQILAGLGRPQRWEERQPLPAIQRGDFVAPAVPPQALIELLEPSGKSPGQPCRVAGAQGLPAKGIGGEVDDLARLAGPTGFAGVAPVEGEDPAQHIVRDHETCTRRPCGIERHRHRVDLSQAGQSLDIGTTRASEDPQPSAVHEQTAAVQYDAAQI